MKRFLIFVLLAVAGITPFILKHKSLAFSPSRLTGHFPSHPEWEVELPPLGNRLDQSYRYLASGSQSYAFLSEDGKTVIKFFRMKHIAPTLSDHLKPGRVERRENNLQSLFSAYMLAYTHMKEDAGLLYIHLSPTTSLHKKLQIIDKLGKKHEVDLDTTPFVVQEKAELIFTHLKRLKAEGKEEEVERSIQAVMGLVKRRIAQGLGDHDKAVSHNYGFVGERPIQLDIGRLYLGNKEGEAERIELRIARWLKES